VSEPNKHADRVKGWNIILRPLGAYIANYDMERVGCLTCFHTWRVIAYPERGAWTAGRWWLCPGNCNVHCLLDRTNRELLQYCTAQAPWDLPPWEPPNDSAFSSACTESSTTAINEGGATSPGIELDLAPVRSSAPTGRHSIIRKLVSDPGYRGKVTKARDLHGSPPYPTWEVVAKQAELGVGADATRKAVAALDKLEAQARQAALR
jgi:hypothetical protein